MNRLCLCLMAVLLSSTVHAGWLSDKQSIMGTEVSLTLWHENPKRAHQAATAVFQEMRRIDSEFSPYIETSQLALLNATAAKQAVSVTPEMTYLIDKSLYFSDVSRGAFDVTFASVGWFYDYRNGRKPSPQQTQSLLPAINYKWLQLDRDKQLLKFGHENVRVDLGGIAKGYAVDQSIAILREYGVEHATVSAGGDSRLLGDKLGRPWLIGIKNPRLKGGEESEVVLTMPLSDVAVSTSGDYERFFIDKESGQRVHHIINPKTGQSVKDVMSVTVLGPRGIDTDALSTTVFVLGVTDGLRLINGLADFDCIIIDSSGQVRYSDGLMTPDIDVEK